MAESGYNWDSWQAMQKGSSDWSADALADNATETGDPTSLDGFAACEIGIGLAEDNTGAIDGVVTVYVLGDADGTNYEETTFSPWSFTITPVQNDTVYKRFTIDPGSYGGFKLAIKNEGGQELAVTVKYRTATIPAAS